MRYTFDLGSIIDQENGNILSELEVRDRLNRYDDENKDLKERIMIIRQYVKENKILLRKDIRDLLE